MPAEVLELPAKGDRIIHFAWEPHVRLLLYMSCKPAVNRCMHVFELESHVHGRIPAAAVCSHQCLKCKGLGCSRQPTRPDCLVMESRARVSPSAPRWPASAITSEQPNRKFHHTCRARGLPSCTATAPSRR